MFLRFFCGFFLELQFSTLFSKLSFGGNRFCGAGLGLAGFFEFVSLDPGVLENLIERNALILRFENFLN